MRREVGTVVAHPQFSNGTEYDMWAANYCQRCWHDRAVNRSSSPDLSKGCQDHGRMFFETVEVLVHTEDNPVGVHCTKFIADDGSDDRGVPTPPPQIEGQLSMDDLTPAEERCDG